MSNILIVDDEESIRITLKEFLRDAGYEVDAAEDVELAMKMLAARDFDVVVSDIILPRITGLALLKSIKEASPQVEVILMTGEPTVETASEAVRAGAFDYLSKPVSKNRFLNAVANAVKLKALGDKARLLVKKNHRYQENLEQLVNKRTEELQESEERWHFALDGNRDGVWDWNVLSGEVFYSKRWKEMRGFSEDEISNHLDEWDKRIHPDDKATVYADLNRHFSHETPYYENEHRTQCKDGSYKWISSRGKVVSWTDDHKPQRMIGTHRDITKRKQAEMLASERRGILELISRGNASQTKIFERLIQIAENHCPKVRASILLLDGNTARSGAASSMPDDFNALVDGLQIGPAAGSCGTAMYRKARVVVAEVRTDPLWADFSHLGEEYGFRACWSEPIMGANGTVLGSFALYHEQAGYPGQAEIHLIESMAYLAGIIIERKQSEEQIRMLSQAIEQSPISVVITDTDLNIEYVNSSFEKVSGYRLEEVIGRNPRMLNVDKTRTPRCEAMWQTITGGKSWQGEFQTKKKNGEILWESVHIAPVLDVSGITAHYLTVLEDITLRKQQEQKLLQQAHFDALTHLPNRFLSLDRLSQLLKEAQRDKTLVAVLFLDLDNFKKVNDTLGHETGDKLLMEAALRLSQVARSGDTVGRLGGDEFIVLLGGLLNANDPRPVVNNILEQFRAPFIIADRELVLTTSIGVSIFPRDGGDISKLLRCADTAMYHAKNLGRNTVASFNDTMNHEVSRRLALEEQMYGALDRNEFSVSYQPMIEVSGGRVVGAEALLRWHNPALGHISPEEFIPIAEQTGLIVPIGQFVITTALGLCARMHPFHDSGCHMAVNLSPLQFRDPELVHFIQKVLQQSGVPAESLELEITEGVLMSGHAYVTDALAALSDMGVSLSMDDFGTGYSSLSYLRTYPFDVLKIDRSFISDITEDPADRALIDATIAMAHGLNLKVVAEGVETEEQLACLKKRGCDYAQGYFFAKPMPGDELFEWMLKRDEGL